MSVSWSASSSGQRTSSDAAAATNPEAMKSRSRVDSCWTQEAAQWWLVATRPSGETKLAEQPRNRTAERIRCRSHSSLAEKPWAALTLALGKLSKVHIPSSAPAARPRSRDNPITRPVWRIMPRLSRRPVAPSIQRSLPSASSNLADEATPMRMLGIAAIFLLSLCAIVEGAFLFRLSRQIRDLSADVATARDGLPRVIVAPSDSSSRPSLAPSRPSAPVRAALPAVPVFAPAGPTGTATATLRDALATPEGRDQLRNAMDVIAEQRRQERLVDYVKRREEREQRWRDRIGKVLPLNPEESTKLN